MSNLSLYQIADEYKSAADELANLELDEQTLADTLDGLSGELEAKATNVAMFVRNLEASAEAIKEAEKQMAERRKAIENRATRIKEYIKTNMEKAEISKIECPYFSLAIRNNPASVVIDDAGKLPDKFLVYPDPPPPRPDKKALGDALKGGEEVSGCHLERGTRLEIK